MTLPQPEDKTQWAIMWIAFGGGIVAATHLGKLPPALPDIMIELDAGLVMGGWIASMISFTGFALGLIAGTVGDRFGQRRVLISGLLIIAAGSLLGAFARSGEIMLLSVLSKASDSAPPRLRVPAWSRMSLRTRIESGHLASGLHTCRSAFPAC